MDTTRTPDALANPVDSQRKKPIKANAKSNQIPYSPSRLLQHRQHPCHGVFAALMPHGHGHIQPAYQITMPVEQRHGDATVVQL